MAIAQYRKIASLKNAGDFKEYIDKLHLPIPFDSDMESGANIALNQPIEFQDRTIGNRLCVLPMEGWDGTKDGLPTELTKRRWRNFGISGCKLIWGGEACAVCHDGKGNPYQLVINDQTVGEIANLRQVLVKAHEQNSQSDDLFIGLQLTHSGRFARPNDNKTAEPKILYNHPILDKRLSLSQDHKCLTDEQIGEIIEQFITAAVLAEQAGFDFVDVKHCHGYLGHEFLSARNRPGPYGGSFENRTRFMREIITGIQKRCPSLKIGMRISFYDFIPFKKDENSVGTPEPYDGNYPYAFGGDGTGLGIDLTETIQLLDMLSAMGIKLICATAGSPYYNPHIQRPAMYPPSDGYLPPEDPLIGVSRMIEACGQLKRKNPDMLFVGTGYTYLQEWLPNVAQSVIRNGLADFIGLGRMMLSYPKMTADILSGKPLDRKHICRTFSDCTTAPRKGLVSGCYPLDNHYKEMPQSNELKRIKKA